MKKIVIASNNLGKLNEIGAILAPLDIEIVPQSTLGVPEIEEPHVTFVENALAKARHASRHTGLPALAERLRLGIGIQDSGFRSRDSTLRPRGSQSSSQPTRRKP